MTLPVVQSSASYHDTVNQTSRTIDKPTGTVSGDWLVLAVAIDVAASITTPTGFTFVKNSIDPANQVKIGLYKRKADGTEGSTFTIATVSEQSAGIIARISGCDSTDCIDIVSCGGGEFGKQPNGRCPNAYAVNDDSVVLRIVSIDGNNTLSTPTSHTLVVYESGGASGVALMMAYVNQATAGYTDSAYSVGGSASEEYASMTVVIRSQNNPQLPDQPVIRCMEYLMPSVSNAIVFDQPYGLVEDDLLAMLISMDSNSFATDLTTTQGFTDIQNSNVGTTIYGRALYKVAGGSEPSTYTGTTSSIGAAVGVLLRIVNYDSASPIDNSTSATGTSTAPASTGFTPSNDNSLLVNLVAADDDDNTYDTNYPSGWTGLVSVANQESADNTLQLAIKTQTTKTATGTVTSALDLSEEWVSILFAINAAAPAGSVGASAGTSTATAVGSSINAQAGTSAGTATAAAVGSSTFAAVGSSAGVGAASAVGQAIKTGAGASAGVATASATGASSFAGVGASAGVATAIAVGASSFAGVGSSAGISTATAVGSSIFAAAGSSAGTSTATAESSGDSEGVGSASGTATASAQAGFIGVSSASATASGVGVTEFRALGSANGVGSAAAVGLAEHRSAGSAAGAAVVVAVGSATAAAAGVASGVAATSAQMGAIGSSTGTSTATAVSQADGVGSSAGVATATAVGAALIEGVGTSAGIATATAVGQSAATGAGAAAGMATVLGQSGAIGSSTGTSTSSAVGAIFANGAGTSTSVSTAIGVANSYFEIDPTSVGYSEISGDTNIYTEIQPSVGSSYTEVA